MTTDATAPTPTPVLPAPGPLPPSEEEKSKFAAEAQKFQAEAEKAKAEARKLNAEASAAESVAVVALLEQEKAEESRQRPRWNDPYADHSYRFMEAVSEASILKCINQLDAWHRSDPKCEITVLFDSPGGSVVDGFHLFDHILELRAAGHKITTKTKGYAASMAGIVLEAGDWRVMGPNATLLLHEVSFNSGGKIGDVEDCVPLDMPVLTSDLRWVPAGDLVEGMELLAFDEFATEGHYRRYRTASVTNANHGPKNCLDVELESGRVMTVSENHPWLSRNSQSWNKWKKTSDLKPGVDKVTRLFNPAEPVDSRDAGYMAGLFDADGTVGCIGPQDRKSWRFNFGQNEGQVFDWVQKHLESEGFEPSLSEHQWPFRQINVYGLQETVRFLSMYRPPRLLQRFQERIDGASAVRGITYDRVIDVRPAGLQECVLLGTSTRTFIGDGYAMHNTVEFAKMLWARALDIFAERCKGASDTTATKRLSRAQLDRRSRRKDWWIGAKDALAYGLVDEIS